MADRGIERHYRGLETCLEVLRDLERRWEMLRYVDCWKVHIYWLLQVRQEGQPSGGFADPGQDRNHSPLPAKSRWVESGEHLTISPIKVSWYYNLTRISLKSCQSENTKICNISSTTRLSSSCTRPGTTRAWPTSRRKGEGGYPWWSWWSWWSWWFWWFWWS